jgi:hypothetical protein
MKDPVVQVIEEKSGDVVYTLRISGTSFRPKVFHDGAYTVKVGDMPGKMKTLAGIKALPLNKEETLKVEL